MPFSSLQDAATSTCPTVKAAPRGHGGAGLCPAAGAVREVA